MLAIPDGICLDIAARHDERLRLAALAGGDLIHRAPGCDGGHVLIEDCRAVLSHRMVVMVLDQQPIGALATVAVVTHPNEHEASVQPLAVQHELEVALLHRLFRRLAALRLPVAPIPEHDRAATILALRDRAFEITIVERVVLDLDREPLVARIERRPLGYRPGFEHAVEFEAEIVMEPGGIVLLDDET